MIELEATESIYDVEITALARVKRTIRVTARGEGHARYIAEEASKKAPATYEWTALGENSIEVDPALLSNFKAAGQPVKVSDQ